MKNPLLHWDEIIESERNSAMISAEQDLVAKMQAKGWQDFRRGLEARHTQAGK